MSAGAMEARAGRWKSVTADAALFAVFFALSLWVVAQALLQVHSGWVWTGTDGLAFQDQAQYLAWIRDAAGHGLISDLFVLAPQPHDYLQPAVEVSGGLTAVGLAPWLALLLWKPIAVTAVFFAVRAFVTRTVRGAQARFFALALALLFTGWGALLAHQLGGLRITWVSITNEMWLDWWSWGYPFGLLGFAAALGALLMYARARAAGRFSLVAPCLGALASWLHPWQGGTLAVLLLATEAVVWVTPVNTRERLNLRLLSWSIAATALPLVYYVILGHDDRAWRLAQGAVFRSWSLSMLLFSLAPLAIPAALGYRRRPETFLDAAARVWPIAIIAVFLGLQGSDTNGGLHTFLGISVPLAVLAVQGIQNLPLPRAENAAAGTAAAAIGVLVLVVPPVANSLSRARSTVRKVAAADLAGPPSRGMFIRSDEARALRWLRDDPLPGGVISRAYLGTLVPGETGRATFVGSTYWGGGKLSYFLASGSADALFLTGLAPQHARSFVSDSGARFALADCATRANLLRELGPLIVADHRFGCASVFQLATPARPAHILASHPAQALPQPGRS